MVFIADKEKQELWAGRIQAFLASGQSGRAWCKEHGLPEHQFGYWLRKHKATVAMSSTSRWVSVETIQPKGSGVSMRIGHVTLEVERGFDCEVLVDVIQTLTALC